MVVALNILHFSIQDCGGGGGGYDAAFRLHRNIQSAGLRSCMVVAQKESNDSSVYRLPQSGLISERIRSCIDRFLLKRKHRYYRPSDYFKLDHSELLSARKLNFILPFVPDLIIAHWITGFVTAKTLAQVGSYFGVPVVWNLVDMGPITGGCHYTLGCEGYKHGCGNCPQLKKHRSENDLSRRQAVERQHAMRIAKSVVVPCTEWLQNRVGESYIFKGVPSKKILLAIDTEIFSPADKSEARAMLGLPDGREILFFGAHNFKETRKGLRLLCESLAILHQQMEGDARLRERILLVSAGNASGLEDYSIPFDHRHIGFLQGDERLALGFKAADIFLNPSIEDAGPMMINESILCGTPVVSFDMGVAPDLVHSGHTGYRAPLADVSEFATGMRLLLSMDAESREIMKTACRKTGLLHCHPDVQTKAYISLIEQYAGNL